MGKIVNKEVIHKASEDRFFEILEYHNTFIQRGRELLAKCPYCGHENSYAYSKAKNIAKCFHCNEKGSNNGIDYLTRALHMPYVDALREAAKILNIDIEEEKFTPKVHQPTKSVPQSTKSFLQEFLSGSGLTPEDVQAKLPPLPGDETNTYLIGRVFKSGSIKRGEIDTEGNDVIIEYYDLDGHPCTYKKKEGKKESLTSYFRVRFAYPEEHLNKEGKAYKYQSPSGSSPHLYIPQKMRDLYNTKSHIETLYIHEGEKKAEKAMKHGIPSVGISGISNIAMTDHASGRKFVSEDLVRIIKDLSVRNVVMVYDSDYKDISNNLHITENVAMRPHQFYCAARNFAEYMRGLKNPPRNLYVDIFIAAILPNGNHDKGIDDLLVNTLRGQESKLAEDLEFFINDKEHHAQYVEGFKITTWSDNKLKEVWSLDHPQKFVKAHFDSLKNMPEFNLFGHQYIIEDGKLKSATPIEKDEEFWKISWIPRGGDKPDKKQLSFNYVGCLRFLQRRGFGRWDNGTKDYKFVHINAQFIEECTHVTMRDFVTDFARGFCDEDVLNMLIKGNTQYIGPNVLSNIEYVRPQMYHGDKDNQRFYFGDKVWEISADGIYEHPYSDISDYTWIENKQPYAVNISEPLFSVSKREDGKFDVSISPIGQQCQILTFLRNTSNFTWRLEREDITEGQIQENIQHLVAKLCSIGYLLSSYKDAGNARAVILMDGKLAEVGASNGRSGKSLVGEMLKRIMQTAMVNGKSKGPAEDPFIWSGVSEKTRMVFVDDVRVNFNLEDYFVYITSDWMVNKKGQDPVIYPFSESPKILITTNHAVNGSTSSFKDRRWLVAFSDYYNEDHKPIHDFGGRLFDDWDQKQWNMCWNMLAQCVQLYMQLGVVQSPDERLEQRQLRQEMGENFLAWATEFYSVEGRLNTPLVKKTLYDEYLAYAPDDRKFTSPTKFKNQIRAFAKYNKYIYNPDMLDPVTGKALKRDQDGREVLRHISNGVEYITLGTNDRFLEVSPVEKLYNAQSNSHEAPF